MCNPSDDCHKCPDFGECSTDAQNDRYAWEQDHCDLPFTQDEYELDDDYGY